MTLAGQHGVTPRVALEHARRALPGSVTVVVGPRQSGRSWLLTQLTDDATVVVRGRPAEAHLDLLAAAPLLEGADASSLATQLEAARQALGDDGLLLVDDLPALDPATRTLVAAIAARASEWGVRMVAASDDAADAAAMGAAPTPLAPLSPGTSPSELGLALDQDAFDRIVDDTGGWPGLVLARHNGALEATVGALTAGLPADVATVVDRLAWGATAEDDSLAGADLDATTVDAGLAGAARAGLLVDGVLPSAVAAAIRSATPPARRRDVAEVVLAHATDDRVIALADHLIAVGDRSDLAQRVLLTAARRNPPGPAAADLFARADELGALDPDDQRRWAAGLVAAGHADQATSVLTRLLDQDAGDPDTCLLAAVSAVANERLRDALGLVERAATDAPDHPLVALRPWFRVAAGEPMSDAVADAVGSTASVQRYALAAAAWLTHGGESRLDDLAGTAQTAADLEAVTAWPQHPLETVAAAATIARDAEASTIAADLLARAGRDARIRQRFVAMRAGRLADAAAATDTPGDGEDEPVGRTARDGSLALAAELGLALRQQAGDHLEAELDRPRMLLTRIQPDLWAADVLSELALVSARLHGLEDATRLLDRVEELADEMPASPALLEVTWTRLIAAVLADDAEAAIAAAAAVEALTGDGRVPRALAAAAAAFRDVYSGEVDAEAIGAITDELKAIGMPFEASHLAAAAALRCTDEAATRNLLAQSRKLRGERRRSRAASSDVDALSDREVDVARLVVLGRTHKDIGAELFISPKTVEHHVARIRRKLGASNRAEMLSAITAYLDTLD